MDYILEHFPGQKSNPKSQKWLFLSHSPILHLVHE